MDSDQVSCPEFRTMSAIERQVEDFFAMDVGGKSNNFTAAIPKLCKLLKETPHNTNHTDQPNQPILVDIPLPSIQSR